MVEKEKGDVPVCAKNLVGLEFGKPISHIGRMTIGSRVDNLNLRKSQMDST